MLRNVDTVSLQNRISFSVTMVGLQARQLKLIPRDSTDELIIWKLNQLVNNNNNNNITLYLKRAAQNS